MNSFVITGPVVDEMRDSGVRQQRLKSNVIGDKSKKADTLRYLLFLNVAPLTGYYF